MPEKPALEGHPASVRKPDGPTGEGALPGLTRECLPDPWCDPSEGRHRRPERPPSGYTEFDPEPPDSLLERLARRWAPNAVLSRRAVLALIVLGALAVALVLALHDRPTTVPAPEMVTRAASAAHPVEEGSGGAEAAEGPSASEAAAAREDLVVHVGGEVEDPGLYTLPPGSRVADAVEEAGGALPEADLDLLNLARPLADGEQVLVGVPPPAGGTGTGHGTGAQGIGGPVNVNQADKALLETLPGIGPVIADNIIAHREEHGPFRGVDDLVNVSKIGEKVLDSLRPHVTVG
ncbi:competence protein ComEA [Nocardiopsis arvandica]|uniref:Competence protein ComEA n=1 Tax=Nocardiopsis sinuspersici TaxID=501010 RepID=A0A7Z0BKH2_9ACTN|nr:competence protein ComEA [Nocardiopsis sinuspersici]